MGDSTPVSDPENISTMKFLLAVVTLFAALACVLAEPDPQLNYFYKSRAAVNGALGYPRAYGGYGGYGGYRGYRGYYGGYNGYFRGKRSADAEPEANGAEAEPEPQAPYYRCTYGSCGDEYFPGYYIGGGALNPVYYSNSQYYNSQYYGGKFGVWG